MHAMCIINKHARIVSASVWC